MKRKKTSSKELIQNIIVQIVVYLLLVVAGFAGLLFYTAYRNAESHEVLFNYNIDTEQSNPVFVKIEKGEGWISEDMFGCQYEFVVENNYKYPISKWTLTIPVPEGCYIDSDWEGDWSLEDTVLSVVPFETNEDVEVKSTRKAGLVLYMPEEQDLNGVIIRYRVHIDYPETVMFKILVALFSFGVASLIITILVGAHINRFEREHNSYKTVVNQALRTIANIIDTKDEYARGHSLRVAIYSKMLAEKMGMNEFDQERIYYIGLLHDVGKVGIPNSILTKPGRLTVDEYEIVKRHTQMGAQLMEGFTTIKGAENGIKYHHERYDGTGYNEGLKGEEIPIEGRIIAVADAYDAMSSKRCYRDILSYDYILNELKINAGTQFDPNIVKCMIELIEGGFAPVSAAEMMEFEI
jgi:putative nucleotidyltransferase with HDIG domain